MNKYVIQEEYVVAVVCYLEIGYGMNMINVLQLLQDYTKRMKNPAQNN